MSTRKQTQSGDPVFARLARHREASRAYDVADDQNDGKEKREWRETERALWSGATTSAGWAALLSYAQKHNLAVKDGEEELWNAIIPRLAVFLEKQREPATQATCPALAMALEMSRVIVAIEDADEARHKDKAHNTRDHRALDDRMEALWWAASYAVPSTIDGATFQLVLASADVDALNNNTFANEYQREERERRCSRLMEQAIGFLTGQCGHAPLWQEAREYFFSENAREGTFLVRALAAVPPRAVA